MSGRVAAVALLALLASAASAAPKPFYELDEDKIAREVARIHKKNPLLRSRVQAVSERFLGTPYKLGPLGEGDDGEFDRDPLYSFAAVDCTTFLEEVMALSVTSDFKKAMTDTLRKIRYKDGVVGFASRNHFPEADWIPRNVWAGYLKDITLEVSPEKTIELGKMISKRDWYAKMSTSSVEGRFTPEERARLAPRLRQLGAALEDQRATIAVLPLDQLPQSLERIPSGTIANLVREDQPDKPVLVTHQVLLIRKDGRSYVRHAAAGKKVQDEPALEYFYRYFNSKWRLVGLNLLEIRDPAERR